MSRPSAEPRCRYMSAGKATEIRLSRCSSIRGILDMVSERTCPNRLGEDEDEKRAARHARWDSRLAEERST